MDRLGIKPEDADSLGKTGYSSQCTYLGRAFRGKSIELVSRRVKEILLNPSYEFPDIDFSEDGADTLSSLRVSAIANPLFKKSPAFSFNTKGLSVTTFAGTVINDTISYVFEMFLPVELEESDYIGCVFSIKKKNKPKDVESQLVEFIKEIDSTDLKLIQKEITNRLPIRPFEKFTEFIHPVLLQKYRSDFSIDLPGAISYLKVLKKI